MTGKRMARATAAICAAVLLAVSVSRAYADRVEMRNGDRYTGKVLELTTNSVVIQNDVLGRISLPREKIVNISFGADPSTNMIGQPTPTNGTARAKASHNPAATPTVQSGNAASADLRFATNSALVREIEDQFLKDAGPEAKAKFHELLGGLANGKLDVDDIRAQAKEAADQIRSLQHDVGGEAGGMLDAYLDVLEKFLKDTAPAAPSLTNAASSQLKLNLSN